MHLSHLFIDLPTWYLNNNVLTFTQANDRIRAVARPGRIVHHADVHTLKGASYRLKHLTDDTLPSVRLSDQTN
jgi:hypothetical protein